MSVNPNEPIKSDEGVSSRGIRLAKKIDRLPPGVFIIRVMKPDLDAASWQIEIHRLDYLEKTSLEKRDT